MVQKIIDIVGTSPQSFAKAASNAVAEAAKTVRGIRWARVEVKAYRATVRIYFDIER